ncbi:hypothetical protein F6R56_11145 [Staphylococcus aureus]|nr:hypothetical protein [Staphylococcus aureus]MBG1028867.1 hypothetical protein [Staphylococcus aureus]
MTERKCACNKLFSILVNLAGVGRRNKFCENIISVPLPLNICVATLFLSCPSRENNTTYNAKYSNCYK